MSRCHKCHGMVYLRLWTRQVGFPRGPRFNICALWLNTPVWSPRVPGRGVIKLAGHTI